MPNAISIMSATYVARELGYRIGGWAQGDAATNAAFRPLETFSERFGTLLDEVAGLGVSAIDLWTAHLNPAWATPGHVAAAKRELGRTNLGVSSLAGGFGSTPEAFAASCKLAAELGAPVLGGSSGLLYTDRDALLSRLREYGVVFGLENPPEKTPAEIRAKLGGPDERLGVALDTGWFGTYGFGAVRVVSELGDVLVHVHLEDVRAAGALQNLPLRRGRRAGRGVRTGTQASRLYGRRKRRARTRDLQPRGRPPREFRPSERLAVMSTPRFTDLAHAAFAVRDVTRTLAFYEHLGVREAFRLHHDDGSLMLVYLHVAEDRFIEIFPGGPEPDPGRNGRFMHLCLLTEDLTGAVAALRAAGIAIDRPPSVGRDTNLQAWISDPDGNPIELMQLSLESPQRRVARGETPNPEDAR